MRKSSVLLSACVCFFLYALLRYPAPLLACCANAISLWLTKVFPSLFPFLAACGIFLRIGAAERIGTMLRPLTRLLFGLDGIAAFPFFLGILSGYPMGAKITASLYEKKLLSLDEAQRILVFSNLPGPLFLIGTVGVGFFGMPLWGYALLFSSFSGAVLTGILWRFSGNSNPKKSRFFSPQTCTLSLTEILSASVSDAMQTILLIGGYLVLFAAISETLRQSGFFSLLCGLLCFLPLSPTAVQGFFSGLLEMTNGAYLLSSAPDNLRLRLTLTAFLVSFGGLSILGQTFSVLSNVPIQKKDYLKGKFVHALFSSLFLYFAFPFLQTYAQKAVPVFSFCTETAFTLSFLWLFPSLFFLLALCCAVLRKR